MIMTSQPWSGPWWSPWRMIRTIMIILENDHGHDCHLGELSMTCLWFRTPWCRRGRKAELGAQLSLSRFSNWEYCDDISHTFEILWISWLCCAYCDNILNAIPILWILWVFQGYILQRWRDMTRESTFATPRTELVNLRPLRSRCKSSVSWNGKRWSTIMTIIRGLIMK